MDFLRCGFCGALATTARHSERLHHDADGIHRSCVCGADGVEAANEKDIQAAASELVLDRLQLEVHTLAPFSKLREQIEGQGYDAILVREPRLALWVRPALTTSVQREASFTAELPSPVVFDGAERDQVLMLRLPPGPGARALLVDVEPTRVGTVRAYLRDVRGVQPISWSELTDEAWATQLTLLEVNAFAAWCGKRVPDDREWQRLAAPDAVGPLAAIGEIWEWTSTPHPDGGHVVRGGRWRDRADRFPRGSAVNRSREERTAADLGMRLVRDG